MITRRKQSDQSSDQEARNKQKVVHTGVIGKSIQPFAHKVPGGYKRRSQFDNGAKNQR